jgi:ribosomal protein S18 acetylase RimI-like enzyme
MAIEYRTNYPVSAEAVAQLFRQSGIRRPVDDLDRIQQMVDHANVTITAWDGELMVGIGRSLTDFSFCCYLSDLAVDKDYQRQGIGKAIVAKTQEILGDDVMLLLLSAPEAMSYYPRIGFEKSDNAWIIQRTP